MALSLPPAVIHGRQRREEKEAEGGFSSFRRVPERKTRRGEASAVPMEIRRDNFFRKCMLELSHTSSKKSPVELSN